MWKDKLVLLGLILSAHEGAFANCESWSPGEKIMELDASLLPEASGLAISRALPHTFYQVNDSGDGSFLYASDSKTRKTTKIKVHSFTPYDVEDIGYGACGKNQCLVLADIGDNKSLRKTISLAVVEEPKELKESLNAIRVVNASYPDGPHNAEALAIHPNGDIFLVTKEKNKKDDPLNARIYRLSGTSWTSDGKDTVPLTFVADIKIAASVFGKKASEKKITSMDIHPSGKRFILLTYNKALEFNIDLAALPAKSVLSDSYQTVEIPNMPKQESIAYSTDGKGFYYTSEANEKKVAKARKKGQDMHQASLMYVECLKPR